MKAWKSTEATTAASSFHDEHIESPPPRKHKPLLKGRRKSERASLISTNWPPVNREERWKRLLYLLSSIIRGVLAVGALISAVGIKMNASGIESDFFIATTVAAGLCTSFFLAAGSITDFGVWKTAPRYYQAEANPSYIYCIYGRSYFEYKVCKFHRLQSFFNRVISTTTRAIVIAFAVPGTQWRWTSCEVSPSLSTQGSNCAGPAVFQNQIRTFIIGLIGTLTPFITEVLWPSKIWSFYSFIGATRLTMGAISTSMSIRYCEGIWRFALGKDDGTLDFHLARSIKIYFHQT
eukprot:Gregarina_sp_Poly_1__5227@NODE_2770_length_1739_cov_35_001196_g1749_i0_p1_GENE_NODE_2770_length_1739_cov_35_001196_g1749_i0NODE_2770_length_1739_cov_35_001196_g1749_i0_p1_ORF_typecomplete_len292_score21_35Phage_holin_8/PF16931_5/0_062Phage_holin_8/PF16931_5/2_3e03DUF3551/PF12071_8/0_21_NODE_2770_length_1739_cov_35_001196_g1749_i07381613